MTGKKQGLERIIKACGYSVAGLKAAWQGEAAFRQEVIFITSTAVDGLLVGAHVS